MGEPKIPGGYYIKSRKIQKSSIMRQPPHVREIWEYLLMNANFEDGILTGGRRIKRGQLFRRYKKIRDDLSWVVGWRKETYNENQVKKAMKFLRENLMIASTKEPGGVLITVLNYDFYQDPKNYERTKDGTTERTNEEPLKNQGVPTYDKKKEEYKEEEINKEELQNGHPEDDISLFNGSQFNDNNEPGGRNSNSGLQTHYEGGQISLYGNGNRCNHGNYYGMGGLDGLVMGNTVGGSSDDPGGNGNRVNGVSGDISLSTGGLDVKKQGGGKVSEADRKKDEEAVTNDSDGSIVDNSFISDSGNSNISDVFSLSCSPPGAGGIQENHGRDGKVVTHEDLDEEKKDKTKQPAKKAKNGIPYKEIIDCLNESTGKNYRHTTKQTQSLIRARWYEGFTVDDFRRVITGRVEKWRGDAKMNEYLRPQTLFGGKFEAYLQDSVPIIPVKNNKSNMINCKECSGKSNCDMISDIPIAACGLFDRIMEDQTI